MKQLTSLKHWGKKLPMFLCAGLLVSLTAYATSAFAPFSSEEAQDNAAVVADGEASADLGYFALEGSGNDMTISSPADYEYSIVSTGGDPYIPMSALTRDLADDEIYVTFEYKSSTGIGDAEFFFANSKGAFAGGVEQSFSLDPASEWTRAFIDIKDSRANFGWGAAGGNLRLDTGTKSGLDLQIRNITITNEKKAPHTLAWSKTAYTTAYWNDPVIAAGSHTGTVNCYADGSLELDGMLDNMKITVDANGNFASINGETVTGDENQYIWINIGDANYYGAWVYPNWSSYVSTDENEGYIIMSGWFYKDYYDSGTWSFFSVQWDDETVATYSPELTQDADGCYMITSTEKLQAYADIVNSGDINANARLLNSVKAPENLMIGTGGDFAGTFDGQGNTITVNMNRTSECAALFYAIATGGTVKNLITDGTINTSGKYAGGVAAYQHGNILNCLSNVTINSSVNGDGTHGGFAGIAYANSVLKNCVFAGSINGSSTNSCAGLYGWTNDSGAVIQNVLVIGDINVDPANCATFGRNNGNLSMTNCYYKTVTNVVKDGATKVTDEQLASGEVAFLLGADQNDLVFSQDLANGQAYPVPFGDKYVYADLKAGTYSNTQTCTEHDFSNGYICANCGTYSTDYCSLVNGAYEVGTVSQYEWFAYIVNIKGELNANARLTADIDLTGKDIMLGSTGQYTGTFDGQGHTVTVDYNRTGSNDAALFEYLSGTVKNLVVDGNISISTKYAAAVAAHTYSGATVENVVSKININSTISGDGTHAGLVAVNESGLNISNCLYAGTMKGDATNNCGGIVGWSSGATTMNNCLMIADIQIGSGDNNILSRNAGNLTATNCYYTDTYPGATANGTLVTADQLKSGEVGYKLGWKQNIGTDAYPNPLTGANIDKNGSSYANYSDLAKNADGIYEISAAGQLVQFSNLVNSGEAGARAILTADIDMSGYDNFTPIGLYSDDSSVQPQHVFTGTFDGQGHVIKNLTVTVNNSYETGLFSRAQGAIIQNFGVENATITNNAGIRCGVVGGELYVSTIRNIYTYGDINITTDHAQKGGIAGEAASTTISRCYTTYDVVANACTLDCSYCGDEVAQGIATGELCWKLNGQSIDNVVYYQTLGTDPRPVLTNTSKPVFADGDTYNNNTPAWYNLKNLIAEANALSSSTKGLDETPLLVTASQLSSNCAWNPQSDVDNLLDNDANSYFHSRIDTPLANAGYYLQADFGKAVSVIKFEFTGRNDGANTGNAWHDTPNDVRIEVSKDGENWTVVESMNLGLPNTDGVHYMSDAINLGDSYNYFRMYVTAATSGQPYWNLSQFQIYECALSADCAYNTVAGLNYAIDDMDACTTAKTPKAEAKNATQADVDELQAKVNRVKAMMNGLATAMPLASTADRIALYYIRNVRQGGKYATYNGEGNLMSEVDDPSDAAMFYFVTTGTESANQMPVRIYNVAAAGAINHDYKTFGIGETWYVRNDLYTTGLAIGKSDVVGNNSMWLNDWSGTQVGNWNANGDAGSVWTIEAVPADKYPADMATWAVNYIVDDNTIYSSTVATTAALPSENLPACTSLQTAAFNYHTKLANIYVNINTPFQASTSLTDMHWYTINNREIDGWQRYFFSGAGESTNLSETAENASKYYWAFIGDPFNGYQVVNRGAGEGQYLTLSASDNGAWPVMSETPQTWDIEYKDDTHFGMGINGFWLNGYGGAGSTTLRTWESGPASDNGSTLTVQPIAADELASAIKITYDPESSEETGATYSVAELDEFHITIDGAYSVAKADNFQAQIVDLTSGKELAKANCTFDGNVITVKLDQPITDQSIAIFTINLKGLIVEGTPYNQVVYAVYYINGRGENEGGSVNTDAINSIMANGTADVYSVNGTLVKKNATVNDVKALKGIYIIKGQKFLMK